MSRCGILVAGIGNVFLTDDGFGSDVARRLAAEAHWPASVRVVDYGIRGMHLAYDLLEGYDALVIVDALPGSKQPGELTLLEVGPDDVGTAALDAHSMDPQSVLGSLAGLGGTLPPTYVVGCQPANVDEGMGLTPQVSRAVDPAMALVIRLVGDLLARRTDVHATAEA